MSATTKKDTKEFLTKSDFFQILKPILSLFCIVGLSTFGIAFVTLWGGKRLDAHFGTAPWIMIAIGLLGLLCDIAVIAMSSMSIARKIQTVLVERKEKEKEEQN